MLSQNHTTGGEGGEGRGVGCVCVGGGGGVGVYTKFTLLEKVLRGSNAGYRHCPDVTASFFAVG